MKKLIIFDFDGVIIQTLQFSYSLVKKTNPDLLWEDYQRMSHGNFYASYESENPTVNYVPNPNFVEEYMKGIRDFDTHPAIQNAIRYLAENHDLTIVSSGHGSVIFNFLEKEDLLKHFNDILGAEVHKSKTVKLKQLLEKYNVQPGDTVFITDSLGDIIEAHEVGIKSIGVLWGLHDRETLERGKPEIIIDDPMLLEETIQAVLEE